MCVCVGGGTLTLCDRLDLSLSLSLSLSLHLSLSLTLSLSPAPHTQSLGLLKKVSLSDDLKSEIVLDDLTS